MDRGIDAGRTRSGDADSEGSGRYHALVGDYSQNSARTRGRTSASRRSSSSSIVREREELGFEDRVGTLCADAIPARPDFRADNLLSDDDKPRERVERASAVRSQL